MLTRKTETLVIFEIKLEVTSSNIMKTTKYQFFLPSYLTI